MLQYPKAQEALVFAVRCLEPSVISFAAALCERWARDMLRADSVVSWIAALIEVGWRRERGSHWPFFWSRRRACARAQADDPASRQKLEGAPARLARRAA
jgi:hypothetical protein